MGRARQSSEERSVSPRPSEGRATGWGSSCPHLQSLGQGPLSRLAPSPPDPNPARAAGFQQSMGLTGPPETGWQQLGAPAAPLLCQLQGWGAGRHGTRRAASPPQPHTKGTGLLRHSGKLRHTGLCTTTGSSGTSHPPGWRRPPAQQESPIPLCVALALSAAVEQGQARRQSYGHPALEASPICWGSCRARDEASLCGAPGKAGQGGLAVCQVPTLGTRMQAAVPPHPTIAPTPLLRLRGPGPPHTSSTWPPPTAHPVPGEAGG